MNRITNVELGEFLKDYKENSTITILEEGKEKNEIFEVAKARGILLKDSKDLAGFKNVYAFTDKANRNGAILPKAKLLKALPSLVGKPIDIDHKRRYVVGFYIDYRYIHKENKVIAYGVFFKNSFAQEWSTVKDLFKKKKLATSFEIWSPKEKYKYHEDGTYEMGEMEVAGGAILFETEPAFKDAMVLELAKKEKVISKDLVFASYKNEELITAESLTLDTVSSITCQNCNQEFLPKDVLALEHKCEHCSAILTKEGAVLYPPQIIDFHLNCPSCKGNSWRVFEKAGETEIMKCLNCKKDYKVDFHVNQDDSLISAFTFLYEGRELCPQCGKVIYFNQSSKTESADLNCKRCNLTFAVDIHSKQKSRKVKSVKYIKRRTVEEKNQTVFAMYKTDMRGKDIELSRRLSLKSRKELSDDMFAIVKSHKIKMNKTHKIRMFPMNDEAHVRNALARLGQEEVVQTIRDLGLTKASVTNKLLKRAKDLNMTKLLKRYDLEKASKEETMEQAKVKAGIKKLALSYLKIKKELAIAKLEIASKTEDKRFGKVLMIARELKGKLNEAKASAIISEQEISFVRKESEEKDSKLEEASQKVELYKENASKLSERRESLGETISKDMSDTQILNDKDFEVAQLKAENAKLKEDKKLPVADDSIGENLEQSNEYYAKKQQEINDQAFKTSK